MLSMECQQSTSSWQIITADNTIHQYDVICVSETFLDSSILLDDRNLSIQGYFIIRADHPDDVKRGGVWLYLKENLTLKKIDNSLLHNALLLSHIDHQANLLLSMMNFCLILINFWIIANSSTFFYNYTRAF